MAIVFAPDTSGDSSKNVALGGGWWLVGGTLTFTGSYVLGGVALDLNKAFGVGGRIRKAIPLGTVKGLSAEYVAATGLLKLYTAGTVTVPTEHTAVAFGTGLTAAPVDVAFLIKLG